MSTSRLAAGIALVAVLTSPMPAGAQRLEAPALTCSACYLVADGGGVLFARAARTLLPNASTTKMTTALAVVESAELDDTVTVSQTAASTGGGGLDLAAGDRYTVHSLLYALLLSSSNDAAVALAEHVDGSEAAFVDGMNELAEKLGATDTNYVTAHGLDMPGHGSSARDLAVIATELLDDPELARIVATSAISIPGPDGDELIENRNLLLEGYRGATGVKTGFTAGAGNVLVASAERGGRTLIAVVMHSVDATADARALLDLGWERLSRTVLLRGGAEVGALVFESGSTAVVAAAPVRGSTRRADVEYTFTPAPDVGSPVFSGEVVGEVLVSGPTGTLARVDALAFGAVDPATRSWAGDAVATVLRTVGALLGDLG